MKIIPLTQGKVALVSDRDWSLVRKYKWCAYKTRWGWRACRGQWVPDTKTTRIILMHRYLLNAQDGEEIDHRNRNPLDNRRCNLRRASRSQNEANIAKHKDNISGHKGVSRNHSNWTARIFHQGRKYYLGTFKTKTEAAAAYARAAVRIFGKFACTQ